MLLGVVVVLRLYFLLLFIFVVVGLLVVFFFFKNKNRASAMREWLLQVEVTHIHIRAFVVKKV